MRRLKFCVMVGLGLGLISLTACSGPDLLNFTIPHKGYHVVRDLGYGIEDPQTLDLYLPNQMKKPAPVVVFFHGGSWQMGSKDDYRFLGQAYASRGYIVAVIDYRLYPDVYFPAFVEDGAKAVAWVHQNITEYGGDPKNIYLVGHSAGGMIGAMLAINEQYLRAAGGSSKWGARLYWLGRAV